MLGHRSLNAEDYFTILKRRWWIVCIPAVILPIAAVGVAYTVTPEYQSESRILIEQQKVPTDVVKGTDTGDLQSHLTLITEQIESRSTLEPIVTKYNLYASQHLSMEARVELVRTKYLHVNTLQSQIGSTGLPGFEVTFTAEDPHTAQQVCADITGLYTGTDLRERSAIAEGTTQFEQAELDEARHTLDDMDHKKAEFEQKNMGMLPGDVGNNANFLNSLSSQLDANNQQLQSLEQNRAVYQAMLAQQTQPAAPAAVSAQTEQADQKLLDTLQTQLADLQSRYTDDYPEVRSTQRQITDLRAQIAKAASAPVPPPSSTPASNRADSMATVQLRAQIHGIEQQIDSKHKMQDQITAQIRSYQGKIQASPEVEEQYKELTRDYETEQTLYNTLQAKLGQSKMSTELGNRSEGEMFNVLDAASLPIDPIYPKQSVFAMGGLGGGIMLGLLIVALLEYKDTALRTERNVWAFTQLPTLAVIAWSGDAADTQKTGRLKRLFSRKDSKEALAG